MGEIFGISKDHFWRWRFYYDVFLNRLHTWYRQWKYPIRIVVAWPVYRGSADPNEHYRPILETKVGIQGRDWNWEVLAHENRLEIMFAAGHEQTATYLALKWS